MVRPRIMKLFWNSNENIYISETILFQGTNQIKSLEHMTSLDNIQKKNKGSDEEKKFKIIESLQKSEKKKKN